MNLYKIAIILSLSVSLFSCQTEGLNSRTPKLDSPKQELSQPREKSTSPTPETNNAPSPDRVEKPDSQTSSEADFKINFNLNGDLFEPGTKLYLRFYDENQLEQDVLNSQWQKDCGNLGNYSTGFNPDDAEAYEKDQIARKECDQRKIREYQELKVKSYSMKMKEGLKFFTLKTNELMEGPIRITLEGTPRGNCFQVSQTLETRLEKGIPKELDLIAKDKWKVKVKPSQYGGYESPESMTSCIHGYIKDDQGQAVEGVLIERLYPNSDTYMRVKTDSNGYYRIREQVNGLPQQMSLNAGKKGYQAAEISALHQNNLDWNPELNRHDFTLSEQQEISDFTLKLELENPTFFDLDFPVKVSLHKIDATTESNHSWNDYPANLKLVEKEVPYQDLNKPIVLHTDQLQSGEWFEVHVNGHEKNDFCPQFAMSKSSFVSDAEMSFITKDWFGVSTALGCIHSYPAQIKVFDEQKQVLSDVIIEAKWDALFSNEPSQKSGRTSTEGIYFLEEVQLDYNLTRNVAVTLIKAGYENTKVNLTLRKPNGDLEANHFELTLKKR